jgi:hypothetical protein
VACINTRARALSCTHITAACAACAAGRHRVHHRRRRRRRQLRGRPQASSPHRATLARATSGQHRHQEAPARPLLLPRPRLESVHFDSDLPMSPLFLSRNIEYGNARMEQVGGQLLPVRPWGREAGRPRPLEGCGGVAARHAARRRRRRACRGMTVSHSCACIGSPCLRQRVHGASIGGGRPGGRQSPRGLPPAAARGSSGGGGWDREREGRDGWHSSGPPR